MSGQVKTVTIPEEEYMKLLSRNLMLDTLIICGITETKEFREAMKLTDEMIEEIETKDDNKT